MLTIFAYDISDDRRRTRVASVLAEYGQRVQQSVFEGRVTDAERRRAVDRVSRLLDAATDSLLVYVVPAPQEARIVAAGRPRPLPAPEPGYYLV